MKDKSVHCRPAAYVRRRKIRRRYEDSRELPLSGKERERAIRSLARSTGLPVGRIAAIERALRTVDVDEILNLEDDIYRLAAALRAHRPSQTTTTNEGRVLS